MSTWPVVMCPGCQVPMGVKAVVEDRPGTDSVTVIYECQICKTEPRDTTNTWTPPAVPARPCRLFDDCRGAQLLCTVDAVPARLRNDYSV